ncbi:phosphopantetheine-binding protein [Gloeobacter morelensis]|uniref:Acyl carrier protein n=1 Tax=Gloeobacter morelensis MG652769 TaxID=2781736 RepID=A0ABY3PRH4_9CYAN|nr:phosphopantetheine-binding protein [Gloeobacter morelensis]UFP96328.1 acyl carrier protein [Gloeobacter morelensis MG652769]
MEMPLLHSVPVEEAVPGYREFCSAVAARLNIDAARLKPESTWVADLGATSVDIVKIVMLIRQRFGVKVPTSQAGRIKTVRDAYLLLGQGR